MFEVDTLCAAWYAIVFKFIFYLLLVAACSIIWSLYFVRRSPIPSLSHHYVSFEFEQKVILHCWDYNSLMIMKRDVWMFTQNSIIIILLNSIIIIIIESLLQWRFAIIMDLQQSWVKAVHSSRLNHGHIFMFPVHWCLCCSL